MQIKIVFYKSSSKFYDQCCLLCETFIDYKSIEKSNVVIILDEEIREKQAIIKNLLDFVRHWKKTEFYIDEEDVSFTDIIDLLDLIQCEKNKCAEIVGDYCFNQNGWGCNKIENISFDGYAHSYYSYKEYYWYQFGHFFEGVWHVDKGRIKTMIQREVDSKHLSFCKYFDINRVWNRVDHLPDTITVNENDDECKWQYVYRKAPAGMEQTEIIEVKPKTESRHDNMGLSININALMDRNRQESDEENKEVEEKKNIPAVSFSDIGGLDNVIQQVREVIELPMVLPKIFEYYHLTPHKGILLYGPPGCGKTIIAKAIANEIKAHFISVKGPEILNKYVGQSEENLRRIFEEAREKQPAIIYFDEFDAISARRDAEDHLSLSTVVNQLLSLMDGLDENRVCCIASTNRLDMIDEAIKRPGRFDYVIEIEKPSLEGCKAIFRIHTKQKPLDNSFDKDAFVKTYLDGLSGAEIAFVASEAAYNSIRRTININDVFSGADIKLSENNVIMEIDFIRAVNTLKERKVKADTAKYRYNL